MTERPHIVIAPATTIKIKRGQEKTTFVEQPKHVQEDTAAEVFHTTKVNPSELQALLDREAPLEHVVVRCNRATGKWYLHKNNKPYKEMDALILIDVSFSCQWKEGETLHGCGNRAESGEYMGFAAGKVLPVATPMTVPTNGIVRIRFNPDNGEFYNGDTLEELEGAGYLILKEGCSAEYVNASAIGTK